MRFDAGVKVAGRRRICRKGRLRCGASERDGEALERTSVGMAGVVGDGEEGVVADSRRSLFSGIADRYDLLNDALSLGQHRVWKTYAVYKAINGLRELNTVEDVHVLDMCCGSGDIALIAATALGSRGRVTGLDFSAELLEIARRKEAFENSENGNAMVAFVLNNRNPVHWVEGDALNVVAQEAEGGARDAGDASCAFFERESFDVVTVGYGLRNLVSVHKAMEEIYALLRPGGRAAILDFNNIQDADENRSSLSVLSNYAKKVRLAIANVCRIIFDAPLILHVCSFVRSFVCFCEESSGGGAPHDCHRHREPIM